MASSRALARITTIEGLSVDRSHPLQQAWIGEQVRVPITGNRAKRILHGAINVRSGDVALLITETHHGLVCASAGVDQSNAPRPGTVVLLPRDPDASAADLRIRLESRTGARLAVIIADTMGRPLRNGIVGTAIATARGNQRAYQRGKALLFSSDMRVRSQSEQV